MNFLDGVNRVLRSNGILRGDDDDIESFSQTQHSATVALAKIAIQDQLSSLVSDNFIPFEDSSSTITLTSGNRLYNLPDDFIRFQGGTDDVALYRLDENDEPDGTMIPYADEGILRRNFPDYREREGGIIYFYLPNSAAAQIGVFNVPGSADAGRKFRFYYEKDVSIENEDDDLPFRSTFVANIFLRMASRHFSLLFQQTGKPNDMDPNALEQDVVLMALRASLIDAMKPLRGNSKWIR